MTSNSRSQKSLDAAMFRALQLQGLRPERTVYGDIVLPARNITEEAIYVATSYVSGALVVVTFDVFSTPDFSDTFHSVAETMVEIHRKLAAREAMKLALEKAEAEKAAWNTLSLDEQVDSLLEEIDVLLDF